MDEQNQAQQQAPRQEVTDAEALQKGISFLGKQKAKLTKMLDDMHISRGWRMYLVFFLILNFFVAQLLLLLLRMALFPSPADIIIIAFALPLLALPFALLLNVFTGVLFIRKYKPQGKLLLFVRVFTVASAGILLYMLYATVSREVEYRDREAGISKEVALQLINDCEVRAMYKYTLGDNTEVNQFATKKQLYGTVYNDLANKDDYDAIYAAFVAASAHCDVLPDERAYRPMYIQVPQATELLTSCQIKGFYYDTTNNTVVKVSNIFPQHGPQTGIILDYQEKPLRIHASHYQAPELVPIAKKAQAKCPDLKIWKDGVREK